VVKEAILPLSLYTAGTWARGTLSTGEEGTIKQLKNRVGRLCPSSQSPYSLLLAVAAAAAVVKMGGTESESLWRCMQGEIDSSSSRTKEQALFVVATCHSLCISCGGK